jgi:hypothetical protein
MQQSLRALGRTTVTGTIVAAVLSVGSDVPQSPKVRRVGSGSSSCLNCSIPYVPGRPNALIASTPKIR